MSDRVHGSAHKLASFAAAVALAACGGGDGGGGSSNGPPAAVTVSGVVADGPLQGATACYDLNDNGVCDSGEPTSGPSGANGAFSIDVAAGDAGRHRIVVDVPASAIDQATGQPVGQAYTLQTPATGDSGAPTTFVSPLTTLVQLRIDTARESLADATAGVQSQAGLAVSPLADYTADTSAAGQSAAALARVVVLAQLRLASTLAPDVVGKADISGATTTNADLEGVIRRDLLEQLPALASAAADPSVAAAPDAASRLAAIATAAQGVADAIAPPASELLQGIGLAKLPPDATPETPTAGASLRMFTFTDRDHWFFRALQASPENDTPDAQGRHRYYDVRSQSGIDASGLHRVDAWGFGASFERRDDLHWNGSAWVTCELGQRSWNTGRDATGFTRYDYCDGFEKGYNVRTPIAIAGQSIRDVIETKVRTFVGSESGRSYATFGPANLALLGSATFPTDAVLYVHANTAQETAASYDVQPTNVVAAYTAAVAAGGDARTASPACAAVTGANNASFLSKVHTLEDLVARNPGTPCIFNKGTNSDGSSLDPNEWWSNGTVGLGSVADAATQPAGTGNYYTTTAIYRLGFDATGNGVRYYSCLQRKADGSPRNCTAIGSGTYRIETLGDARVMTFAGMPAATQRTGFERVFVERGGDVYFGYRNVIGTRRVLGFNLAAANALFTQLGLQPLQPIPPASAADAAKAALFATVKGVWAIFDQNDAIVFRFGDDGSYVMAETEGDAARSSQPGLERGFVDVDPATHKVRRLIATDTNWESGLSHPGPGEDVIATITPTQIGDTSFTLTRLPNDPNGIVGYWAGARTGLNTQQVVFFPNGRVLLIDPIGEMAPSNAGSPCFVARQGPPGIEWASYTFDAATGALHVSGKQVDTNGCAGLFDSSAGGPGNTTADFVLTFTADKMQLTTNEGDTLYRIAP